VSVSDPGSNVPKSLGQCSGRCQAQGTEEWEEPNGVLGPLIRSCTSRPWAYHRVAAVAALARNACHRAADIQAVPCAGRHGQAGLGNRSESNAVAALAEGDHSAEHPYRPCWLLGWDLRAEVRRNRCYSEEEGAAFEDMVAVEPSDLNFSDRHGA